MQETFSSQVTTIMGENLCNRERKLLVCRNTLHFFLNIIFLLGIETNESLNILFLTIISNANLQVEEFKFLRDEFLFFFFVLKLSFGSLTSKMK